MKHVLLTTIFAGSLAILWVPLIVSESMLFPYISGKNFFFRIIVELMFVAWVLLALFDVRFRPRWSHLFTSVGFFVGALGVSALVGVDPLKSVWSNFERMEGWVTLVHFALYIVVCGSLLQVGTFRLFDTLEVTIWRWWLYTSLLVAVIVGVNALSEFSAGSASQGWRVEGTLGNAAYMAVYMLFSMLVTLWIAFTTRSVWWRYTLLAFLVYFGFLLLQTGTRGVLVGLVAGVFCGGIYFALCTKRNKRLRLWIGGIIAFLIIAFSTLLVFQHHPLVKENRALGRISSINLSELSVRITVWNIAIEGVKERPILGWGQGNFSHIFAKYHDPAMANQETWFDRAHNVFLDWLVAGGVIGLFAYLSMFAVLAWYVLLAPVFGRYTDAFTDIERTLIIGISAGYFVQNLVVFDTLVSYIYFALLISFVHSRVSFELPYILRPKFSRYNLITIGAPVALIIALMVVYVVNVPYMQAGKLVISGLREGNINFFIEALSKHPAAGEEVMGQLYTTIATEIQNEKNSTETKEALAALVIKETESYQVENVSRPPFEMRLLQFYIQINSKLALAQADYLGDLAPRKIDVLVLRGIASFLNEDTEKAKELWTEAYRLYPDGHQAQLYYAITHLLNNDVAAVESVLQTDAARRQFLLLPLTMKIATEKEQWAIVEKGLELQLQNGASVQTLVNLAVVQNNQGKKSEAIVTLEKAMSLDPSTEDALLCVIDNIKNNREPNTACQ